MNILWIIMLVVSLGFCLASNPNVAITIMTDSVSNSITLCIGLMGIYVLWMGFIQIIQDSGLADKLARVLTPFLRLLFGDVSKEARKFIAINISCNILGLGNASTPAGLKAMKLLNDNKDKPNYAMAMLFCINCCSLQLFPTTMISMRSNHGSTASSDIIFPIIIVSVLCFIMCVLLVKIVYKRAEK